MMNKALRLIAEMFGKDGHIKVREEWTMDWQKILQKLMESIKDVNLGIILEGFQMAATEGYEAAVHYVVLAHNAKAGADAAGVTLEQAKKVIKGTVLQLH
jgi:hypothetical protein